MKQNGFVVIALFFQLSLNVQGKSSHCLDRYYSVVNKNSNFVGRPADPEVLADFQYSLLVRYKCPESFELTGEWKHFSGNEFLLQCSLGTRFLKENVWPICRGPYENVTCTNEYQSWNSSTGKPWLKPTPNLVHAHYSPMKYSYKYDSELLFYCPEGMKIHRATGLTVMISRCKKDGGWTTEWPLCKGQTCPLLSISDGKVIGENQRYDVGTVLRIKCDPGFFLWGNSKIKCLENLTWDNPRVACLTYTEFKRLCRFEGKKLQVTYDQNRLMSLKCFSRKLAVKARPVKFTTELATSVGIPLCFLFALMFVMVVYVKHRRNRSCAQSVEVALTNRYGETVNLILPTYKEALKTKPTTPPPTFDETFGFSGDENIPTTLFPIPIEDQTTSHPRGCREVATADRQVTRCRRHPPPYDNIEETNSDSSAQAPPSYASRISLVNIDHIT